MNNVPFFEHPCLSWANLDCYGGWAYEKRYLYTAVQQRKKLVSDFDITVVSANAADSKSLVTAEIDRLAFRDNIDIGLGRPYQRGQQIFWPVIAARAGTLRNFFDLDTILAVYKAHGVKINRQNLKEYFEIPLITLYRGEYRGFDFANVETDVECVINGLAPGYPIESTVSVITGGC